MAMAPLPVCLWDIIAALRQDREEEKACQAKGAAQAMTQPTAPVTAMLMKWPKDLGCPIDPPAVGSTVWIVEKATFGARQSSKVLVTAVPTDACSQYTVLAYARDGSLMTSKPCICGFDAFMLETEARNLATAV